MDSLGLFLLCLYLLFDLEIKFSFLTLHCCIEPSNYESIIPLHKILIVDMRFRMHT